MDLSPPYQKEENNLFFYNIESIEDKAILKSKIIISSLNSFVMGLCISFGTLNKYVFPNYLEFTNKHKFFYIFRITTSTMMFYMTTLIIRHLNKREKLQIQREKFNISTKEKIRLLSKDTLYKFLFFSVIYKSYFFKNNIQLTNKSNFLIFLTCAYMIDIHELYKDVKSI